MSATEEVQSVTAEQPQPEAPDAAEKPVKEKKARAPKEKKPKAPKTAAHPPYFEMIKEALLALNEKSGSSPYAIAKYMEEKHKAVLPTNFRKILGLQLKNSATRGKLIKIKASYKLSEAGKKDTAAAAVKKPGAKPKANAEKKKPQPKATTAVRTRSARKTEANKITPAKPAKKPAQTKKRSAAAKPKQPKSIKSPAAKKAKKAVAATAV